MKKVTKGFAPLAVLALVATGCGGGDSSGDTCDEDDLTCDYGVTDDTIRIGLNADLSGPFAGLVTQIVEAQEVSF